MRRILLVAIAIVGVLAVRIAAQNTSYVQDPRWVVPGEAAAKANPLAGNSAAVAGGRKLFMKNCSRCHGEDGSGKGSAADLQLAVVQQQSDGALFWKITNGNLPRRMPSFSNLPELQRWQIVLYIRALQDRQGSRQDDNKR